MPRSPAVSKAQGVVFLGKLNLDEMAFEGTGTTGCFGPAHNPWNLDHITGGSSAGSAAAVSAGLCFGSVGSDDGGSVRIPGAFCGVVGFKTSYGRVSTRGVVPSAYSMDTIGPITRSVEDAAALSKSLPVSIRWMPSRYANQYRTTGRHSTHPLPTSALVFRASTFSSSFTRMLHLP
jgi:Asp-tRNA(Asn)/Glu-tRNA(Gln) amidotransferase A subunit family amidase